MGVTHLHVALGDIERGDTSVREATGDGTAEHALAVVREVMGDGALESADASERGSPPPLPASPRTLRPTFQ